MTASKVFLSYAHAGADKDFTSELYQRLKNDGVECFFDEASIAPGDNFVLAISEAIDRCNYLVMVLSPAYAASRFAAAEWSPIFTDDPKNERGRLVPLLRESCDPPRILRPLHWIDVTTRAKLEQSYPAIWQHVNQPQPEDIEERANEIDELFDQDQPELAIKRLLDFAHQFARAMGVTNRLRAIQMEFNRVDQEDDLAKRAMARVSLIEEGLNLRDGIISTLSLETGS